MPRGNNYLRELLRNLRRVRERAGISETELEERLLLAPGWVNRFEQGQSVPSILMLQAILQKLGADMRDLVEGLPEADAISMERTIFAEQMVDDLVIRFRYANYNANYTLPRATTEEFEKVLSTLRGGLARLVGTDENQSTAIKSDAVATTFLTAANLWPHVNPSDLWWFVIYRAYCDPYNHPAVFARLDLTQSWKRTGGWALEEVLARHYGPFLKTRGVNLFIADGAAKQGLVEALDLDDRVEADKIDVVLTGDTPRGEEFFGVVHVKASFAERRTDDVPMSTVLANSGYTSPLWTMDCKSMPGEFPTNRGELGEATDRRSAKRRDIEDEGYFTGCFSYNRNTLPSSEDLPAERRVHVCDFNDPDDAFSRFIIERWQRFPKD